MFIGLTIGFLRQDDGAQQETKDQIHEFHTGQHLKLQKRNQDLNFNRIDLLSDTKIPAISGDSSFQFSWINRFAAV
jgi:hypothetical protein